MTPGTGVRVQSRCTANGRTGTVAETALFWRLMGWRRVEFDPKPHRPSWGVFPASELQRIADAERPAPAQSSLWGAP